MVQQRMEEYPDLDHWKTTMEFSIEQLALLTAAIDPFDMTLHQAKENNHPRWKKAHGYANGMASAIRQGLITPIICIGYDSQGYPYTIKPSDREIDISYSETIISRASYIGWIENQNIQITRKPKPKTISSELAVTTHQPITTQQVPLLITTSAHTSEGLEFVEDAIKQLWSTYDPDEPKTAPTKQEVVDYLKSRGASQNVALAVDLILRPQGLRHAGLKNQKAPTR